MQPGLTTPDLQHDAAALASVAAASAGAVVVAGQSNSLGFQSLAMKTFASVQTQHGLLAAQRALKAEDYQTAAEHQAAFPSGLDYPLWKERAPAPDLQR